MGKRLALLTPALLEIAREVILRGGVVIYPTDTLYGLGVDATNPEAVQRLNRIKGRRGPLSVIAGNRRMAAGWLDLKPRQRTPVLELLGGPTTVIAPVKAGVVDPAVLGPERTLGIRIPGHSFGPRLVVRCGVPVTTTSVNRSGSPPLNDPEIIQKEFGSEIDLLVDDGPLPVVGASTIYRWQAGRIVQVRVRS